MTDGWKTLEVVLLEAGYLYDEVLVEERHEEVEEETFEFFHKDPIRVVIVRPPSRCRFR